MPRCICGNTSTLGRIQMPFKVREILSSRSSLPLEGYLLFPLKQNPARSTTPSISNNPRRANPTNDNRVYDVVIRVHNDQRLKNF